MYGSRWLWQPICSECSTSSSNVTPQCAHRIATAPLAPSSSDACPAAADTCPAAEHWTATSSLARPASGNETANAHCVATSATAVFAASLPVAPSCDASKSADGRRRRLPSIARSIGVGVPLTRGARRQIARFFVIAGPLPPSSSSSSLAARTAASRSSGGQSASDGGDGGGGDDDDVASVTSTLMTTSSHAPAPPGHDDRSPAAMPTFGDARAVVVAAAVAVGNTGLPPLCMIVCTIERRQPLADARDSGRSSSSALLRSVAVPVARGRGAAAVASAVRDHQASPPSAAAAAAAGGLLAAVPPLSRRYAAIHSRCARDAAAANTTQLRRRTAAKLSN